MASATGICNSALIKLGETRTTAIFPSDGSKGANLCNEQYDKMREELLRSHPWNFAGALKKLAQLSDTPAFEFDFAYQLPSDWLRVLTVHDNDAGVGRVVYRIQGDTLLSSATAIYLRYVKDVTDANAMDALFREALAWKLAADIALSLTQSMTTMEAAQKAFLLALGTAKGTDAVEDYPEQVPEDDWITARS